MSNIQKVRKMIKEALLKELEGQLFDSETAQDVVEQLKK